MLVLYAPLGQAALLGGMSGGVANLLGYAQGGTDFLFGKLATPEIGGNSFAIAALPVIIFFASLVSILYYLGIMQLVVRWVGGGDREGDRRLEGRIAVRGGEHLRRPERIAARHPPLSRRA